MKLYKVTVPLKNPSSRRPYSKGGYKYIAAKSIDIVASDQPNAFEIEQLGEIKIIQG